MKSYSEALKQFVRDVNSLMERHNKERASVLRPHTVEVVTGRSYDKVVRLDNGIKGRPKPSNPTRSAYCFIRKSENAAKGDRVGDILKAESWKSPADVPRGNIFDDEPLDAVTVYGAKYLR